MRFIKYLRQVTQTNKIGYSSMRATKIFPEQA